MDFSEFEEVVGLWCDQRPATPLDCWVDDANARTEVLGSGVRCSIELLDPYDTNDPSVSRRCSVTVVPALRVPVTVPSPSIRKPAVWFWSVGYPTLAVSLIC